VHRPLTEATTTASSGSRVGSCGSPRSITESNTGWSYLRYAPPMRVTSKGQVTIPQNVRRQLGITPGSEVEFQLDDRGARLIRVSDHGGRAIAHRMRGRATVTLSTEEIMALTRGDD